jgi:hypothetical protein
MWAEKLDVFRSLQVLPLLWLVVWQHISFIGKYEFYNGRDVIDIQQLIENIIADLKIDISSTEHE